MEEKLEQVLHQNHAYSEEIMRLEANFEQERSILKKKLEDAEHRVNHIGDTYDEKLKV